jgi:metallo-beta-lactamase family protein
LSYIQFLGVAGTVTGSKHLVSTSSDPGRNPGFQLLIDCGMFQGAKPWRERNWQPLPIAAYGIDAVILTHAHLDHCGWIPRLVREGFRGPIFATPSTIDLCGIILPDSGHLQVEDANFYNPHKRSRHHPALPLYTLAEAEACLKYFQPVPLEEIRQLSAEVSFRLVRAAHILGSSMVELELAANGPVRRLLFTGDIGRVPNSNVAPGQVVRSGPSLGEAADVLFERRDVGPDGHGFTENTHFRGAALDHEATRARRLESDEDHRVFRVGQPLHQVVQNSAPGRHPAG